MLLPPLIKMLNSTVGECDSFADMHVTAPWCKNDDHLDCLKDVEKSKSMELYDCPFHVCFDESEGMRMAQGETDNKVPVGKEVQ